MALELTSVPAVGSWWGRQCVSHPVLCLRWVSALALMPTSWHPNSSLGHLSEYWPQGTSCPPSAPKSTCEVRLYVCRRTTTLSVHKLGTQHHKNPVWSQGAPRTFPAKAIYGQSTSVLFSSLGFGWFQCSHPYLWGILLPHHVRHPWWV